MIKKIMKHSCSSCFEFRIEHPIDEIGEISMFVVRVIERNIYIFTIPFHNWSYSKLDGENISFNYGPSAFGHEKYKNQLINDMHKIIKIIEDDST